MDPRTTLVVSYSRSGCCDKAARWIVEALDCDHERIVAERPYDGMRGFMRGGWQALRQKTPPIAPPRYDPDRYNRVVLVFPIWASRVAPPVGSYLLRRSGFMQEVYAVTVAESSDGTAAVAAIAADYGVTAVGHLAVARRGIEDESARAGICAFAQEGV